MSAPEPEPVASRKARGLLAALVAFAVGVIVWLGFGFWFARDVHLVRALATFGAAFVCARVVVSRAPRAARGAALVLAFVGAAAAWWFVPGFAGAPSLAEANERCAAAVARTDVPLFDAPERGPLVWREIEDVGNHYHFFYRIWSKHVSDWYGTAYRTVNQKWSALDWRDVDGARDLISREEKFRLSGAVANKARAEWEQRALAAGLKELAEVPVSDWDGFARTAAGRKEFGELTDASALAEAETDWVNRTARAELLKNPLAGSEHWAAVERRLLELTTLATDDARFSAARLSLFDRAHEAAQRAATKHIEAREYDAAFALARAHAVRWNATASIFGEAETKKLDQLRDACAVLARFAEIAGPPDEPAPPPREREVAPPPRAKP